MKKFYKIGTTLLASIAISPIVLSSLSTTQVKADSTQAQQTTQNNQNVDDHTQQLINQVFNQNDNQTTQQNSQYNDFINKYNNSIILTEQGYYTIDYSKLPKNTNVNDIDTLKNIINNSNNSLNNSYNNKNNLNIQRQGNSMMVSKSNQDQQDQNSIEDKSLPSGKTFVHYYWWGLRIGLSETKVHHIGNIIEGGGAAAAGYAAISELGIVDVPEASFAEGIADAAGAIGWGVTNIPCGIVYNYTPNLGPWGEEIQ